MQFDCANGQCEQRPSYIHDTRNGKWYQEMHLEPPENELIGFIRRTLVIIWVKDTAEGLEHVIVSNSKSPTEK